MKSNVIEEIKKLDVKIAKRLFKEAKKEGIKRPPSPLQARILKYILAHKEEVICQKNLEDYLKISKATISAVLVTMEKTGIIKRVSIPEDARAKRIMLTTTSLERFQELENNFKAINEELIKGLTDHELAQFLNILDKMQKNMKEEGEESV